MRKIEEVSQEELIHDNFIRQNPPAGYLLIFLPSFEENGKSPHFSNVG